MSRRPSEKPTYRPRIATGADGQLEQAFTAAYVTLEPTEDGEARILGFTEDEYQFIHGLIITAPAEPPFGPGEVEVEFNDQGNTRSGSDVSVALRGTELVVEYGEGAEVWAGRISFAEAADPLRDDPAGAADLAVRRVVVTLAVDAAMQAAVVAELERLRQAGMAVHLAPA